MEDIRPAQGPSRLSGRQARARPVLLKPCCSGRAPFLGWARSIRETAWAMPAPKRGRGGGSTELNLMGFEWVGERCGGRRAGLGRL